MIFFFNFQKIKFLRGKSRNDEKVRATESWEKVLNPSTTYKNFHFVIKELDTSQLKPYLFQDFEVWPK